MNISFALCQREKGEAHIGHMSEDDDFESDEEEEFEEEEFDDDDGDE